MNDIFRRISPMHGSHSRWTGIAAAAALMALPLTAAAQSTTTPPTQSTSPQQPSSPQQPTSSPQPPTSPQPQPPPAQTAPADPALQPQTPASDTGAAKQHLSEARDSLSQLTSLPEAARLQGDARTQVSALISNFNSLITAQSNWRDAYSKVDANLTTLLGADTATDQPIPSGVAGAVGTSGATAPGVGGLDPAVQAKLVEFRTHLKAFEHAAGGGAAAGNMAPGVATGTTANPSSPTAATPANPGDPNAAPAATAAATSSVTPTSTSATSTSPTSTMPAADRTTAADAVSHADADKELDAISAILNESKTGALSKTQTADLKKHVEQLRQLLQQGK
jgi:hypothetical protein